VTFYYKKEKIEMISEIKSASSAVFVLTTITASSFIHVYPRKSVVDIFFGDSSVVFLENPL